MDSAGDNPNIYDSFASLPSERQQVMSPRGVPAGGIVGPLRLCEMVFQLRRTEFSLEVTILHMRGRWTLERMALYRYLRTQVQLLQHPMTKHAGTSDSRGG